MANLKQGMPAKRSQGVNILIGSEGMREKGIVY